MDITFPGESSEYRAARQRLLEQEIELRRAMERVAAARRALPPGGGVSEDYVFQGAGADGAPTDLRLSVPASSASPTSLATAQSSSCIRSPDPARSQSRCADTLRQRR